MSIVSNYEITNFMDIFYNDNGFVLPAVHSRFVCSVVIEEIIREIWKFNVIET